MSTYITAGEFATLCGTTKRTILFYDHIGVLTPVKINEVGYRLYEERQVLEYQKILLLRTLDVSLEEIKLSIAKKGDLSALFEEKKYLIKQEIDTLRFNLNNIEQYTNNLKENGTLVQPEIKIFKPIDIYYIKKTGSYAKIGRYCEELKTLFSHTGTSFTTLSIFEDQGYLPKTSHLIIGAIASLKMRLKTESHHIVKRMMFNPGKVLSYTYHGPGSMLSLFWKELEKYAKLHKLTVRTDVPDFEIYWNVNRNPFKQRFEIFLPIK